MSIDVGETHHGVPPATPADRRVQRVDACTDPRWAQVAERAGASLFISPPWLRAVCGTYGLSAEGRVIEVGGVPAAGLVSIDVDDHRGRKRSSLPFCDRADPVVADRALWPLLLHDCIADGLRFTMRCLDGTAPTMHPGLHREHEAAWHGSSIIGTPEELFAGLHPTARRNVRAARRHGVQIETSAELPAVHRFFDLHLRLRKRKYRLLAQPREFFERIWTEFAPSDAVLTMLAKRDGTTVAGALFLVWKDRLYYKFGASLQEHLDARPNDALFWAAMQWANARGLRLVDWGLSERDQPGLVAYKRKWASEERSIVTLRAGQSAAVPDPKLADVFRELTEILTRNDVPDDVTQRAGALLYRYFA